MIDSFIRPESLGQALMNSAADARIGPVAFRCMAPDIFSPEGCLLIGDSAFP
jgi:hypothetical protein